VNCFWFESLIIRQHIDDRNRWRYNIAFNLVGEKSMRIRAGINWLIEVSEV
jgi:hypothetical protein